MNILPLMYDKLEVNLNIWQPLHAHQSRLLSLICVFLQAFSNWPIQDCLNVIDDILKHLMMHL